MMMSSDIVQQFSFHFFMRLYLHLSRVVELLFLLFVVKPMSFIHSQCLEKSIFVEPLNTAEDTVIALCEMAESM